MCVSDLCSEPQIRDGELAWVLLAGAREEEEEGEAASSWWSFQRGGSNQCCSSAERREVGHFRLSLWHRESRRQAQHKEHEPSGGSEKTKSSYINPTYKRARGSETGPTQLRSKTFCFLTLHLTLKLNFNMIFTSSLEEHDPEHLNERHQKSGSLICKTFWAAVLSSCTISMINVVYK